MFVSGATMTDPKLCCGQPPMIFSAKNAAGDKIRIVHSIACLSCGRSEEHTDRNQAIQKFNKAVNSGNTKGSAAGLEVSIKHSLALFKNTKPARVLDSSEVRTRRGVV